MAWRRFRAPERTVFRTIVSRGHKTSWKGFPGNRNDLSSESRPNVRLFDDLSLTHPLPGHFGDGGCGEIRRLGPAPEPPVRAASVACGARCDHGENPVVAVFFDSAGMPCYTPAELPASFKSESRCSNMRMRSRSRAIQARVSVKGPFAARDGPTVTDGGHPSRCSRISPVGYCT